MYNPAEILIIDDTPTNLEVLYAALDYAGYEILVEMDGQSGIERAQQKQPDLILLDVMMPGMNGFEVCDRLQSDPTTCEIPIIFMTALSETDHKVRGLRSGAVDYITKPFQADEALARIEIHLKLRELTQTLEQKVQQRTAELSEALETLQRSQLQLIQNEKMSALGNLVAGVAHEMNNPIGFISGNLSETKRSLQDILEHLKLYRMNADRTKIEDHAEAIDLDYLLEDLPKMIESMQMGCDRIRNISTSLRTFSRADTETKTPFNLQDGIDSTLLILKHRLKATRSHPEIEVITHYTDLPEVDCFPGQLNQVFMNVIANAIDALEDAYQKDSSFQGRIQIQASMFDQTVQIKISDNGNGMSEETQQRVFEHLFTTKQAGKGTGLGLAIAYQIITEKHQGTIEVRSMPGQGTEFTIAIPAYAS